MSSSRVNIVECNQRVSKDGSLETTDAELKSVQQSHSWAAREITDGLIQELLQKLLHAESEVE